jgi:hypothetical protein
MSGARDRDERGRPRNARPRDDLGRPLPRSVADPAAVLAAMSPRQSLVRAQELLDAGRPFQAHEVLEAAWKTAAPEHRDLWQGLTQLAVGLTHAARGTLSGALALLRRGHERLDRCPPAAPWEVDLPGLRRWVEASTARLQEFNGGSELSPPRLCTSAALVRLRRWEEFGGTWTVTARTQDQITLALGRCDGEERVDAWTSGDAGLLRFVGARTSSERPD